MPTYQDFSLSLLLYILLSQKIPRPYGLTYESYGLMQVSESTQFPVYSLAQSFYMKNQSLPSFQVTALLHSSAGANCINCNTKKLRSVHFQFRLSTKQIKVFLCFLKAFTENNFRTLQAVFHLLETALIHYCSESGERKGVTDYL